MLICGQPFLTLLSLNNSLLYHLPRTTASNLQQANQRAKGSRAESLQNDFPNPSSVKCPSAFTEREQASLSNSCLISPLQIPLRPAAWILHRDGSALPATGVESNVMGRSRQIVSMAFSLGSAAPVAPCLLEENANAIAFFPPLLFKAETFILNSQPHKSLLFVAGLLRPRNAC